MFKLFHLLVISRYALQVLRTERISPQRNFKNTLNGNIKIEKGKVIAQRQNKQTEIAAANVTSLKDTSVGY